jgi:hypothetical protein
MENTQNMQKLKNGMQKSNAGWIISGVAIGSGIALAYAASRKKKNWRDRLMDTADTVARRREDLAESGKNIVDRVRIIYEESRKVMEEASELWAHGRKLVRW